MGIICPKLNQGQDEQVAEGSRRKGHFKPAQVDRGAKLRVMAQEVNQWHCQTGPLLA